MTTFDTTVEIIHSLTEPNWSSSRSVCGQLYVTDNIATHLRTLFEDGIITDVYNPDNTAIPKNTGWERNTVGRSVTVSLSLHGVGQIYKDFDSFLNFNTNRFTIPQNRFYTVDEKIDSQSSEPTTLMQAYRDTVKLAQFLSDLSDIPERMQSTPAYIFFVGSKKIYIQVQYAAADITPIPLLYDLIKDIQTAVHVDEKKGIFKTTLIDSLSIESDSTKFFALLLKKFNSIFEEYKQSYNVYVTQFSIKMVKQEIEENKLELANKLNGIMSELSKTLLTIPLAFIFVAPRITSTTPSLVNTVLVVSFFVFALFTFLSFANHKQMLSIISDEISRQENIITANYSGISNVVLPAFGNLNKRCTYQKRTRVFIGVLLWFGLGLIAFLYFFQNALPSFHFHLSDKAIEFFSTPSNSTHPAQPFTSP